MSRPTIANEKVTGNISTTLRELLSSFPLPPDQGLNTELIRKQARETGIPEKKFELILKLNFQLLFSTFFKCFKTFKLFLVLPKERF